MLHQTQHVKEFKHGGFSKWAVTIKLWDFIHGKKWEFGYLNKSVGAVLWTLWHTGHAGQLVNQKHSEIHR